MLDSVEDREEPSQRELDVGANVGRTENVTVLTFVLVDVCVALSIIFAAKSIVLREDVKQHSLFYLATTLVNVTCSLLAGLLAQWLLDLL